jgi:dipeptide/tripeptide permease
MEGSYKKLAITIAINSLVMFLLTYVMIDSMDHFLLNINKLYMTLMMVAPMVVLMLIVMGSMYKNKNLNYALIALFVALFAAVFWLARTQTPIGNEQFLRSMIPHHSSAILMCEESAITDPEILSMCEEIVATQEEEIAQMEDILARLSQ